MEHESEAREIAFRIRGLIAGQDQGLIEATARRLGVTELSLRISIDDDEPHPTFEVLTALIREYGVDPTWLITGGYDVVSHRIAVDAEARYAAMELARVMSKTPNGASPAVSEAPPSQHLRLEA